MGALPRVCFSNRLLDSGVTITTDGDDAANAYDGLTYSVWTTNSATSYLTAQLSGAAACDYCGIAAHDIGTQGGTVAIQHSADGVTWTTAASVTPSDDGVILMFFASVSAVYWRVYLTGLSGDASVGVVSFGEYLELERGPYSGYVPPPFARRVNVYNNMSQGGQFLGRSIVDEGIEGAMTLEALSEAWVRSDLADFLDHTVTRGWFLSWEPTAYPEDACYVWTPDGQPPRPSYSRAGFMAVTIEYMGITE
jgi:hypothetical protein